MPDDLKVSHQETLARFLARTDFSALPVEVINRSRWVVADSLAVIAAGMQEPEMQHLVRHLATEEGNGPATLIGSPTRLGCSMAAFVNGTAGTFLELDEGNQFARGHPGIHVVPAALARGEALGCNGTDFLLAIALGYEVGSRIGIASKIRLSMHPHGTWGTVGAAVAVGKLGGYDARRFRGLINLSSCLGLTTSRRTMLEGGTVRNSYSGISNELGLRADQMIRAGFTGEADGLRTVYGSVVSEAFEESLMTEALGKRWEIARNYFKMHACCRYNHGSLDALGDILAGRPAGSLDPTQIVRVDIDTYSLAAQLSNQAPENMLAAKFSLPFSVATAIVNGHAGLESYRAAALANETTQALARRVFVREDPALTRMMPARRPSRMTITLSSGESLKAEVFSNKGDTEDPYCETELEQKFQRLGASVWGKSRAAQILDTVMTLDRLTDLRKLTALLPTH